MSAAVFEDLDWSADAVATIEALANAGTFTADDLRREMRPAPHGNMIGAAFTTARKLGYIRTIGYQTSNTQSRRRGVVRVWARKEQK